jgi:hypothetical protein
LEKTLRLTGWRFSLAETAAFGFSLTSMSVAITLWTVGTFQSKEDAKEIKAQLEIRIQSIEQQTKELRNSVDGVAKDVSYIRGRLEPKNEKGY